MFMLMFVASILITLACLLCMNSSHHSVSFFSLWLIFKTFYQKRINSYNCHSIYSSIYFLICSSFIRKPTPPPQKRQRTRGPFLRHTWLVGRQSKSNWSTSSNCGLFWKHIKIIPQRSRGVMGVWTPGLMGTRLSFTSEPEGVYK